MALERLLLFTFSARFHLFSQSDSLRTVTWLWNVSYCLDFLLGFIFSANQIPCQQVGWSETLFAVFQLKGSWTFNNVFNFDEFPPRTVLWFLNFFVRNTFDHYLSIATLKHHDTQFTGANSRTKHPEQDSANRRHFIDVHIFACQVFWFSLLITN